MYLFSFSIFSTILCCSDKGGKGIIVCPNSEPEISLNVVPDALDIICQSYKCIVYKSDNF